MLGFNFTNRRKIVIPMKNLTRVKMGKDFNGSTDYDSLVFTTKLPVQ